MRKSLLVTLEFPPQKGGVQTYYFNICKNLPNGKIVVLAPINEKPSLNHSAGWRTVESRLNPSYRQGENVVSQTKRIDKDDNVINFKIYRKNLLVKYLYPHWLTIIWHLYKIIKKEKIELIQVGQILPCGAAVFLISKFLQIPYIVYTHGLDILCPQKNTRKKKLIIKILRNAEKIISNSEFTRNEVAKLGIERENIFVVYPTVESVGCAGYQNSTAQFIGGDGNVCAWIDNEERQPSNALEELRKRYNLSDKKILLSVCRLVERKGVDLIISALTKFSKELKNLIYVVVGDGLKIEDLKREIPAECPQVIFTGMIGDEELDLWYRLCDIFILTPKRSEFDVEGFGIVYIEAGSYSKPVIGSKIAGICEAVNDGVSGILVEPDNIGQIGEAIIRIFNDDELREKLGQHGKERVEKEFNIVKQMGVLLKIL